MSSHSSDCEEPPLVVTGVCTGLCPVELVPALPVLLRTRNCRSLRIVCRRKTASCKGGVLFAVVSHMSRSPANRNSNSRGTARLILFGQRASPSLFCIAHVRSVPPSALLCSLQHRDVGAEGAGMKVTFPVRITPGSQSQLEEMVSS